MSPVTDASDDPGFPSEQEILAIGELHNAPERNAWITWSYHRLDRAMAKVTGDADLSWCAFATWASSTAGGFISESVFPKLLVDWIHHTHKGATLFERAQILALDILGFPVHALAREILAAVSGSIGDGNRAVFLDVAPPYARLLTTLAGRPRLEPDERKAFLASLRHGTDADVEKALRKAFEAILDATETSDPRLRSEHILAANAWVGWSEQTLVQRYIVSSMNAPDLDLFRGVMFQHVRKFHRLADRLPDRALRELIEPIAQLLMLAFRDIETVYMMRLTTPGAVFHLGRDVPPLAGGRAFPEALTDITSPDLDQLLMLLHAQKLEGTAACDWSSFDQRMRYIGTLFRSRQQDLSMRTSVPPRPTSPLPASAAV